MINIQTHIYTHVYIIHPPQERQPTPHNTKVPYLEARPDAKNSHPHGKAAHPQTASTHIYENCINTKHRASVLILNHNPL